ncbi:uncharacterized protein BDV14DRAFT_184467 [Aspergillus stella-maris]|uniref:uncharacterized protein n=1 Tax=Aspergillus stella-maris TaxID=1810926 RepID=UPI003CCD54A7
MLHAIILDSCLITPSPTHPPLYAIIGAHVCCIPNVSYFTLILKPRLCAFVVPWSSSCPDTFRRLISLH